MIICRRKLLKLTLIKKTNVPITYFRTIVIAIGEFLRRINASAMNNNNNKRRKDGKCRAWAFMLQRSHDSAFNEAECRNPQLIWRNYGFTHSRSAPDINNSNQNRSTNAPDRSRLAEFAVRFLEIAEAIAANF